MTENLNHGRWWHRSGFEAVGQLPAFSQTEVAAHLNVFRLEAQRALDDSDPILRAFATALPEDWRRKDVIIRSKMAWLQPGWLPGPARWHADQAFIRPDGHEDYRAPGTPGRHTVAAVVGDCSLTHFVTDDIELPDIAEGQPVRAQVSHDIETRVRQGRLATTALREGEVVRFGYGDFHRATPATHAGWRVILRATVRRPDQPVGGDNTAWQTTINAYEPDSAEAMALYAPYL